MHPKTILLALGPLAQLIWAQAPTPFPGVKASSLLRRDGEPLASCPEQFGNPAMNCDNPACGGQAETAPGICKLNSGSGKPCQCKVGTTTDVPPPVPVTTVVTTTNAEGATITGTYELITIDAYKSLRQSQTVTISQTSTGDDGQPTVAAVAAVIAAGGVAWILGTAADAAGAAVLEPPPPPEANKDDPTCPAEKHKCDDCGAVAGINICVTPDGGCACEPAKDKCPAEDKKPECSDTGCVGVDGKCTIGDLNTCACKSCPTGDKQPQCADEKCKGEDSKCTVGDNKGCGCKEDPCPKPPNTPFCDVCGGKADDGKCKGDPKEDNAWKGCDCNDYGKYEEPPLLVQVPMGGEPDLSDISPSSYSYGGGNNPKCANTQFPAKRDDIKKTVTEWCKSVDKKKVTKEGKDNVIYKRYDYAYFSYWLGAQYDGESGGKCGNDAEVREINCVSTMLEELDDCNAGDDFKGAELTDGCVKYHVALGGSKNDDDPPFKPLPKPVCPVKSNEDWTDVTYLFFKGISKTFCKNVGDTKKETINDLTNKDFVKRSLPRRSEKARRTPPPSGKDYEGFKFHFEWKPDGEGCQRGCDDAMDKFTSACGGTGVGNTRMATKGSYDTGCGKYSYSISPRPPPPPPPPPPERKNSCILYYKVWFYEVQVSFPPDDDSLEEKVHNEMKGCGAMTEWRPMGVDLGYRRVSFQLPLFIKSGCVERALTTATGLPANHGQNDNKCWGP